MRAKTSVSDGGDGVPRIIVNDQCRFLYVVGQLGLGGLERQLYYLLANLDQARYRSAVVVWNLNPHEKYYREIEALNIPIFGFPPEWSALSKLKAFRAVARQVAPEIIHSYAFYTNFAAFYAAQGTSALAIGSLRSDFERAKRDVGFIRGVLNARWPSCLVANSRAAAEGARRHTGALAPKKVLFVRNGIDLNQFSFSCDTIDKRYVGAIGSLLRVKRWDRLLRAVQKVKVFNAGVRFYIAGGGPLRVGLEKLALELGISETVEFLGETAGIPAILRATKFLVHTSESEGCPNAVMEAMACGIPVIAMEAGDIRYLVDDGSNGYVVAQDDEDGLVKKIILLLNDEKLCRRMGQAARAKAEREFSLQRLVMETLDSYRAAGWKKQA